MADFAYTFDAENAEAPSRHTTQYFEMMGQWALYHDGWLLSTKVNRAPWQAFQAANADPLNNQVFQLYNLNENFNQSVDIAADHPDKVKAMRAMFLEEAKQYQVLPLSASVAARVAAPRPSLTAGLNELVYTRPMTGLPQGDAPYLLNTSYTISADITVPEGGAEGMIVTSGGRFAGWGFYLLDGKPVFNWNLLNLEWVKWEGPDALTPGQHNVEFAFEYDGLGLGTIAYNSFAGVGKGGTGRLKVDGKVVAGGHREAGDGHEEGSPRYPVARNAKTLPPGLGEKPGGCKKGNAPPNTRSTVTSRRRPHPAAPVGADLRQQF